MQIPGVKDFFTSYSNYFLESSWKGKTVQVLFAASIITLIYLIAFRKKPSPKDPGIPSTSPSENLSGRAHPPQKLKKELIQAALSYFKNQPNPPTYTPEQFQQLLSKNHRFPPKVIVTGNLDLKNSNIETLPAGLEVRGNLCLEGCINLKSLPEGLKVEGDLYLSGRVHNTSQGLIVKSNLLTSLPQGLEVGGDLHLFSCTSLISLPRGLKVKGCLNLTGCTNLKSLPEGLEVGGDLLLNDCTSLTSLPWGLRVGGNLILSGNTNLKWLFDKLEVGGNLDIIECPSLEMMPNGMKVGGNLEIRGCSNLKALSHRQSWSPSLPFVVKGDLKVSACRGLVLLPQELNLGGNVRFAFCPSLTSLPSWMTTLGPRTDGNTRVVTLEDTGLSSTIIERLHQAPAPGMEFHLSHPVTVPIEFLDLGAVLDFWGMGETFVYLIDQKNHVEVMRFLARLTETDEYKNLHTRPHLASRVVEAFHHMAVDIEIKANACELIHAGLATRNGTIISTLDRIELMILVKKIENTEHSAEELKKLGKSFLFLEMVKAKSHKEALTWIDEVEVYLAFQLGLAKRFELPIKTYLSFLPSIEITQDQLKTFGDEIEQTYTDEKLETFLKTWSPWVEFQRQLVPISNPLLDRKAEALTRLCQIEALGDKLTDMFEAKAKMLQFNLDKALQRYPVDQEPYALCSFLDWAEVNLFKKISFRIVISLEKFKDIRSTDQYVMTKDLLSRLNSYFAQKRAQVIVGSPAELHLKEQFRHSVDKIIDASRDCIDQMLLQSQELMLNFIADDFTAIHSGDKQQGRVLFRAGHELCKYRMNLLKEICIRQNCNEQHVADLELAILKELSTALDDILGMQGSIFKIGTPYINLLDNVSYRASLVLREFLNAYKPLEYLVKQIKTPHGCMNNLRNELNTWAKTYYGIEEEDADHPAETDMNPRLVENYNPDTFSDFVYNGEWTLAATFLLLERAGLISQKQVG
jgi:hypothetical protein